MSARAGFFAGEATVEGLLRALLMGWAIGAESRSSVSSSVADGSERSGVFICGRLCSSSTDILSEVASSSVEDAEAASALGSPLALRFAVREAAGVRVIDDSRALRG